MIYDIVHTTLYDYDGRVSFARCQLHLEPAERDGQRVLSHRLEIEPLPIERVGITDFFGNRSLNLAFAEPHQRLAIRAVSRVEAAPAAPAPLLSEPWEAVRAAAAASRNIGPRSPVHGLFGARHTPLSEEAAAYGAESFPPSRPVVEAVSCLMRRIHADFTYDPQATEISTPLAEVIATRRGVCQDFAHLMIATMRSLGLPALYVSGYLRTTPPPGGEKLVGADATHAWVSAWCGDGVGWIGFDPTNAMLAGAQHVVLAVGRDYADVAPTSGVVLASTGHRLSVSVDVTPVGAPGHGP